MNLKETLTALTVSELKTLVALLPGKSSGLVRKDDLIERISSSLLGPDLPAAWASLDPTQQAAVALAVHDPAGVYSGFRFQARYQRLPAFRVQTGNKPYFDRPDGKRTALCLFIYNSGVENCQFVPSDLRQRLQAFAPEPEPLHLKSSPTLLEQEGLTLRLTERDAAQELRVMLRTIEQSRITVGEKTALPGKAALRLLYDQLLDSDFYPWFTKKDGYEQEIGPIKAFAWPMLLQAGGLALRTGSRLTLSPAGIKALNAAPAEVLRRLWSKWQKTTLLDEFSRVDVIKGQNAPGRVMTALAPRRAAVEVALQACPVGRWVAFDDFSRFMQAADLTFEVVHDPWKLYISDRQYGSLGYTGSNGWNILQERYILVLLFEYAATLGMVDLAYVDPDGARGDFSDMWGTDDLSFLSRYDGLRQFRLTALGAYLLGQTNDYTAQASASDLMLALQPSLDLHVVHGRLGAEQTLLLANWAEALPSSGGWRLERQRALTALEKGHDIAELQRFLEQHSEPPLPVPVASFIEHCQRDGKALKVGASALLLDCRDEATAETVANHKETSPWCLRAGPQTLVVRSEQIDRFRERLHLLGLGLIA